MAARQPPKLLRGAQLDAHRYAGPTKFRGRCERCGDPRNQHCGRCRACPGYHAVDCMVSHATGAWH